MKLANFKALGGGKMTLKVLIGLAFCAVPETETVIVVYEQDAREDIS